MPKSKKNFIDATSRHITFGLDVSANMRKMNGMDEAKKLIKDYVADVKSHVDVITFGQRVVAYANQSSEQLDELMPQLKPVEMLCHVARMLDVAFNWHSTNGQGFESAVLIITASLPSEKVFFVDMLADIARKIDNRREFEIKILFPRNTPLDTQNYYAGCGDDANELGITVDTALIEDFDFSSFL